MIIILKPGQHIKASRLFFEHHGVHIGNGWVAELSKPWEGGTIRYVSLAEFARGGTVSLVHHANALPPGAVLENVRRAPSDLSYRLLDWNCEHFATWCATGVARSAQVEAVANLATMLLLALSVSALTKR